MTLGIALLGTGSIVHRGFAPAVHTLDDARLAAVLRRDTTYSMSPPQHLWYTPAGENPYASLLYP